MTMPPLRFDNGGAGCDFRTSSAFKCFRKVVGEHARGKTATAWYTELFRT